MASQLLPLGACGISIHCGPTDPSIELIDKCVGSRIWVIMKGDKGESANEAGKCAAESSRAYRVLGYLAWIRRLRQ